MNSNDPFSFFSEVMKQLQHESTRPMYFYAGTSTRKASVKAILPDRVHMTCIVAPVLDVYKPEHCLVDHLKSCNVANQPPNP